MKIANGRTHFYQWELNQRLVLDVDCGEVHYENGTQSTALCCAVNEVNGVRECDVPNKLLQTASDLHAFAWDKKKTHVVGHAVFTVIPRSKPDDYVYTETEVWTAEKAVAEALEKAKASGEFKGDKGDPGPVGPQGETGPQGYSPVRGTDYWTEEDKAEIVEEAEKTAIGDIETAADEILKMQEELLNGVNAYWEVDTTLTKEGTPADAKAVGDMFANLPAGVTETRFSMTPDEPAYFLDDYKVFLVMAIIESGNASYPCMYACNHDMYYNLNAHKLFGDVSLGIYTDYDYGVRIECPSQVDLGDDYSETIYGAHVQIWS